jgi:hypothetical protein
MTWTRKGSGTPWRISGGLDHAKEFEVTMGKEYNLLTKRLLAEGYTAENHPDYVKVGGYGCRNESLDNWDGGFIYVRMYAEKIVYKTGCGKFVMGKTCFGNMGTMGVDWTHENNNPVFRCPYDKPECEMNDSRLHGMHGGGLCIQCWCTCHSTDEPYDYENSIEKANMERKEEMERKYREYSDAKKGHICQNHMYYNEREREWHLEYNPKYCASMRCNGQSSRDFEQHELQCPILGRALDKKNGNVFYDLKISFLRKDLIGTLFEGQIDTQVIKGKRVFKSNVSMDICRNYVKLCKDDLIHDVRMQYHQELFFSEHYKDYFDVEVLNIRAETRQSRDLMQDLQDIRDGIQIIYEDETEKEIQKLEKKLIDVGYENLDSYDQNRIHKFIDSDRLGELIDIRQQKLKEEREKPVQLSIFDMSDY